MLSTFQASKITVWIFNILFSKRTWKLAGISFVAFCIWYSGYTAINTYNFIHQDGVYGIVTEEKWHDIVTAQDQVREADRKARLEAESDTHISANNKQALETWDLPINE